MIFVPIAFCWVLLQTETSSTLAPPRLGAEAFQRAFEDAFDERDASHIEQVVRDNPTEFVPLFEKYARSWIERDDAKTDESRKILERCRAIGESAAKAFAVRGVLEMEVALEGFDDSKRAKWREATANSEQGSAAYARFAWDDALDPLTRAEAAFTDLEWPSGVARAANTLGNCYHLLGRFDKAIECHELALAVKTKIGNPRDIAASLNNLGTSYDSVALYEKALEHHEKALAIEDTLGNPERIAGTLNNLGTCYTALGQYEKAIGYHSKALALREHLGKPRDIAGSLNNLGICYESLNKYDKAIEYHEKALALKEKLGNSQDHASSLTNLGLCYSALGQYEKAIGYHEKALALDEKIGNPRRSSNSFSNLGTCYYSLGQYDKAISYHEKALALREKIGNSQDLARTFTNLGTCCYSQGRYEKALAHFERCVTEVAKVGRRTQSEDERGAFIARWSKIPSLISGSARQLAANPNSRALERGFPLVESFLSRTLLEGLQERAEGVLSAADPALSGKRAEMLDEMEALRFRLAKEAQKSPDESPVAADLRARVDEAWKAWVEIDHRLRQKSPKLGELVAPVPASLHSVQESALAKDEALLLFVLGKEESFLWAITADKAIVFSLPAEEVIDRAHGRLANALSSVERADDSFVEPARELYKLLLAPAETFLQSHERWIVVPDGALGFLPFEVLLTRDTPSEKKADLAHLPYLLREHSVRYAPSASLLVWFASQGKSDKAWKKDVVLFGDPLYSREIDGLEPLALAARGSLDLEQFARLEKTRDEVKSIGESLIGNGEDKLLLELRDLPRSGHLTASRFDLFVGTEASRGRLTQDLTGYRIVHLAVHGFFDTQFPWFSGIVLSDDRDKRGSGFVNLIDIGTLKLDAQIVFLSACDTAKGKSEQCEGIKNTARSFLLAGAQSVIATQWSVADEAAPIVAQAFYRRLFAGASAAEALRQAKLALIDQREVAGMERRDAARGVGGVSSRKASDRDAQRWAHPAFWAPFVLWGG